VTGAEFFRLPDERCNYLGLSDRIRDRHGVQTGGAAIYSSFSNALHTQAIAITLHSNPPRP
jgi:hypothetical protein